MSAKKPPAFGRIIADIKKMEERIGKPRIPGVALFDLDDTLLVGDIGEAVFLMLKRKEAVEPVTANGRPIPFTWEEYRTLLKSGRTATAYRRMVAAMAGIPRDVVAGTTGDVLQLAGRRLRYADTVIRCPRPHPVMRDLVAWLQQRRYRPVVISASNQISVRRVCQAWFNIPENSAFGIRSLPDRRYRGQKNSGRHILSSTLARPVPIGAGKRAAYLRFIGDHPVLISAGNSVTDLQMLKLTHHQGYIIWAGDRETWDQHMPAKRGGSRSCHFLKRG